MAIIDEARIMPINRTVTCDKVFSDIYAFGVICEVTGAKHKFNVRFIISNMLLNIIYVTS